MRLNDWLFFASSPPLPRPTDSSNSQDGSRTAGKQSRRGHPEFRVRVRAHHRSLPPTTTTSTMTTRVGRRLRQPPKRGIMSLLRQSSSRLLSTMLHRQWHGQRWQRQFPTVTLTGVLKRWVSWTGPSRSRPPLRPYTIKIDRHRNACIEPECIPTGNREDPQRHHRPCHYR
jgi:hypothetical protein